MSTDDRHGRRDPATADPRPFQALLAESGIGPETGQALAPALAELAALGTGDPPAPSHELAGLLEAADRAHRAGARPRPARTRPVPRPRRAAIAALTAAACLAGAGAAAATDEGFRHTVHDTIAVIASTLTGTRPEAPQNPPPAPEPAASPAHDAPSTPPGPVHSPGPGASPTTGASSLPAAPGGAPQGTTRPAGQGTVPAQSGSTPGHGRRADAPAPGAQPTAPPAPPDILRPTARPTAAQSAPVSTGGQGAANAPRLQGTAAPTGERP